MDLSSAPSPGPPTAGTLESTDTPKALPADDAEGSASTTEDPYPAVNGMACHGKEVEWGACLNQPPCQLCERRDCEFADWSDWYQLGGCTGLCVRDRAITVSNNECGQPCNGSKRETKSDSDCLRADCIVPDKDCEFSEWEPWSVCGNHYAQSYRSRQILQSPAGGGAACAGASNQTRPCGAEMPSDCKLSDWEEWTQCSSRCGGGWKARERAIAKPSRHGGRPCEDTLRETVPCNTHGCGVAKPCELSQWDSWNGCDATDRHQKFRTREITRGPEGGGLDCAFTLRETEPCANIGPLEPIVCGLTEWSAWSLCSATCNGQQFRSRTIVVDTRSYCYVNTDFPLKEVKACGPESCEPEELRCSLSAWSEWGDCSQSCGVGVTTRSRTVAHAGTGCLSSLKEVRACKSMECMLTDCQWGEWDEWSGCSCSCGGGLHRRSRVIVASPRNGGKLCSPEEKYQVAPCATEPCDHCIDGEWGEWGEWSRCSATCLPAQRVRHRSISRPPNSCGKPVSGLEDEYELCVEFPPCVPDVHCLLSEWQEWSACSNQCFGTRERSRRIVQFASGAGRECAGSVMDIAPCNPAPQEEVPSACGPAPERACRVAMWGEWSPCSASCGAGQTKRERTIIAPNINDGRPCNSTLAEVAHCEAAACDHGSCTDCRWGAWSEWGDCSKCGGQRFRHRGIEQMPNHCGEKCDLRPAKEVGRCTSHCEEERFCVWSAWSDMSSCDGRCGKVTKLRSRQMTLVSEQPQEAAEAVGLGQCLDAADNTYASYGSVVSSRDECLTILKGLGNVPGVRGAEHQEIDNRCHIIVDAGSPVPPAAEGVVLEEGGGGMGSVAKTSGELPWRCWRRVTPFLFKGDRNAPCSGVQTDMAECPYVRCDAECRPADCVFSEWQPWVADCTQLCERSRHVEQFSSCGGTPCDGPLVQTKVCLKNCTETRDCVLGDWSQWDPIHCEPPFQRVRSRIVLQEPKNGGAPCVGALEETESCAVRLQDTADCQVGRWESWSECSRSCGPGIRMRSRIVSSQATGGGTPCEGPLEELQSCILAICPVAERDGLLGDWSVWSSCTHRGLAFRHRNVSIEPHDGGDPVAGPVLEARSCNVGIDCEVSEWTHWSKCDERCGGGQQHRHRQVTRNPQNGGKECVHSLQEVSGCNRFACEVVDCQASEWTEWSQCSADCGIGQRTRSRYLDHMAEPGGTGCDLNLTVAEPCVGSVGCEGMVNCRWADWGDWDGCSCDCDGGSHKRTREVAAMPTKGGKPCDPLSKEEVAPCNTQPCHVEDCIDGAWDEWEEWSECSSTCDGGITSRSRSVRREANECGKPAVGFKVEHASCNAHVACEDSVDCVFSEWTSWSSCFAMTDPCTGRQQRSRGFKQQGRGDGRFCLGAMKEEQACLPSEALGCESREPANCVLDSWEEWEKCDASCGKGQTVRKRSVVQPESNGGSPCEKPLEETQPCDSGVQCETTCEKKDCAWSEWSEWSSCTKCGGQKVRSRHVAQPSECGGLPCEPGAAEEATDCPRQCHDPQYCVWGEWSEWDPCMQDCGHSIRKRERMLRRVSVKPTPPPEGGSLPEGALLEGVGLEDLQAKFARLHQRAAGLEARRQRELALCFGAGCLSLLLGMMAVRTCSRARCMDVQERLYAAAPTVALNALRSLSREQGHAYQEVGYPGPPSAVAEEEGW